MIRLVFIVMLPLLMFSILTACGNEAVTENDINNQKEGTKQMTNQNEVDTEVIQTYNEGVAFDLVYTGWKGMGEDNQNFFTYLYEGDSLKAKEMYENYFLKFNLVHEVSHTIQFLYGVDVDRYSSEQGANDLAVAYWREVDPAFVNELSTIVDHILSTLESPIPEGKDEAIYFEEKYHELATDPSAYGYYQFKFVYNAIHDDKDLHGMLVKNINPLIQDKTTDLDVDLMYIVGDVEEIVKGYTSYLAMYNLDSPKIYLVENSTPSIQYVTVHEEG